MKGSCDLTNIFETNLIYAAGLSRTVRERAELRACDVRKEATQCGKIYWEVRGDENSKGQNFCLNGFESRINQIRFRVILPIGTYTDSLVFITFLRSYPATHSEQIRSNPFQSSSDKVNCQMLTPSVNNLHTVTLFPFLLPNNCLLYPRN